MAGSLGDFLGPIALGLIAQLMGVIAVFQAVAGTVMVGAVLVAAFGVVAAYRAGHVQVVGTTSGHSGR
jgi:hypothetical protein